MTVVLGNFAKCMSLPIKKYEVNEIFVARNLKKQLRKQQCFLCAQILQMHCMARRLKDSNISVNSCHPGIVDTEISRNFEDSFLWKVVFWKGAKLLGR